MQLRSVLAAFFGMALSASTLFGQAPIITDFNPKVGGPGDTVYIYGSGFNSGTVFRFPNGQVVTSRYVNGPTQVTTTVPSGITTGPLSVQNPGGAEFFSADSFLAIGPGPYISAVTPNLAAINDQVAILGAHFTGAI